MFHRFANPARFMAVAAMILPWMTALAAGLLLVGLYFALLASPADYQQGETVRIMYVHVPAAWMALFVYVAMAAASASFLIWRHPLADIFAQAAAPLGAAFTAAALITGSLWGKPMWGTWWVWDARLTSMLILLFLYLGYIALSQAFDNRERGARAAAVLALVGVINVPIIKFSVDWWNTLHQPASVIKMSGPAIDPSMLFPLLLMAAGMKAYFLVVVILRMRARLLSRRVQVLKLLAAET
jgi:heme exporter protein C